MPRSTLLVVDDDPVARDLLVEVLSREGYRVRGAAGGEECVRLAQAEPCDLALVDLRMEDLDGLAVLKHLASLRPAPTVLILTAFASMETAIEAIRAGAYDYLSKPFRIDEIKVAVRRALDARRLVQENQQYRHQLQERYGVEKLVGQSPEMVAIYKLVARVAALDTTILIQGETGTGKEMVARAIHYASPRADRPMVVVDCAALPEPLFESELFGHERGAFTGAVTSRRGLLETADATTCFLDEVGELSTALQAKLLRVLQERVIRRVGGNEAIPVNVRLITATNQDLRRLVDEGRFREDLYYRLNGVTLRVPALRERRQDVPLLAQHFLEKYAGEAGKTILGFARETLEFLTAYRWPGNVRELQHVVERAVALSSSALILPEDLPPEIRAESLPAPELPRARMSLDEVKRWYVGRVLDETGGNKLRAAELLGIDRRTLYRILERESEETPEGEGRSAG
jgi:DNA-binding NtrC family response regulator